MKPLFTPAGGIGSTWKDPKTGQAYKFTAQGWVEQTEDIKKQVTEKGTFEIKPDEEDLVEKLKAGGSNQEQINKGLTERRRILSNLGQQGKTMFQEAGTKEPDLTNPFGGMTKQEILIDAFNKGVTKETELSKLEKIYDLFNPPEDDWSFAEETIRLSPDASREELRVALRKRTELSISDIDTLLDREMVTKETPFTDENMKEMAKALVKGVGSKEQALEQAQLGRIKVNEKDVTLSRKQIATLVKYINEQKETKGIIQTIFRR